MTFNRRSLLAAGVAGLTLPGTALARPVGADRPLVERFVAEQKFQGVVLTGRAGRMTYARCFGMADVEARRPVTLDTAFDIASISKWLTTTAILRLVEQGVLSLDAPISTWLPDYRADIGAKVSLRRLMSNTSGIPNLFGPAAKADPTLAQKEISTAEAVKRFCEGDLIFEPGARFDYAMTNWLIVVAIVEAVTGRPFQTAMRNLALGPLDLSHTDASPAVATAPTTAMSYSSIDPPVRRPNDRLQVMAAAGGYFSTAGDLLRAAHLVFDTGFLSPASREEMLKIEVPEQCYALGGRVRTLTIGGKPLPAAWETGRTAGYRSLLGHRLDTRETLVVLNNSDMSQRTLDEFGDAMFGSTPLA